MRDQRGRLSALHKRRNRSQANSARFLWRTDETAFMHDELIQSAILQKLIVLARPLRA
jgi:hypothetical protein